MRSLTPEEAKAVDDSVDAEEGFRAIEATIKELADLNVGAACGTPGNECFKALVEYGYGSRTCRGWYDHVHNDVMGMFHIELGTDEETEEVERVARLSGGSLRYEGDSRSWKGFKEFEIE